MLKYLSSFFCAFLLSFTALFGAPSNHGGPPPRPDKLDYTSQSAHIKLQRAENILSTLVPDPQSYQLVLSSNTSFGGEAVPPYVLTDKPTIIVYQGSLSPDRSNEELAFMIAHETGHLNLHHSLKMDMQMDKMFNGPITGISGRTFAIFYQKLQEQQADLFGLNLYYHAGYNLNFFPYTLNLIKQNPNIHIGSAKVFRKPLPSLSMKDSHFSMQDRFELLVHESQKLA